jgi:hypothetical protein
LAKLTFEKFPGLTSVSGGQMTHAQPQVKIITPQGRMQMQQIQTPSGPKLIAVPVGGGSIQVIQIHQQQPLGKFFTNQRFRLIF